MRPRDYQEAAHAATWDFLHSRFGLNPLVVEPTGTGKSLQMSMLIWSLLKSYPNLRILSVSHVKELVDGNFNELMKLWPGAPAGVYSAGLKQRDHRSQVVFASIMSVAKKAALFKKVDFVIVDEAHAISGHETASYTKFLDNLRGANPNLVVVGYTATPFRMKGGLITNGPLFDEICFDLSSGEAFLWLLDQGYLSRPVPKHPGFQLDSDDIDLVSGDFHDSQASQALRDQNILERAVDAMVAIGREQGRKSWLHFCQSVEDAELVADMLSYKGEPHEAVHSQRADRDEVLKDFKAGKLRGVTNKNILTTGFNHPGIDMIGVLRVTRSPGLWVQMVGRGTRPVYAPGFDLATVDGRRGAMLAGPKQTCLVMDFVGNTERLGPINYPRIPAKRRNKGKPDLKSMVKLCPECGSYVHISQKSCEDCGHVFPVKQVLRDEASDKDLVRSKPVLDLTKPLAPVEKTTEVHGVHRMVVSRHKGRNGKQDTMRVDYFCSFNRFSEWVCIEHRKGTYPRQKAEQWWQAHGTGTCPATIEEAVDAVACLSKPKFIKVQKTGARFDIVGHDFIGTRFELPPEAGGPPLSNPGRDPLGALPDSPGLIELKSMDDIPF